MIGIANLSSLVSGNKKAAPASALPTRPSAPNAAQVNSFETQQQLQARRDAEDHHRQRELAAAMQQLQAAQAVPGPEASGAPPMTPAQRAVIYGDSPNAPSQTSDVSQMQAEAKDGFRPSLYLSIENPPFLALVVEALGESGPLGLPAISVAHYGQQNGETDAIGKLFAAFVRRADEGTLSRLLVEATVLLAAARTNPAVVLREAASTYKVDIDAIALKVKQEFAAKEKARVVKKEPEAERQRKKQAA